MRGNRTSRFLAVMLLTGGVSAWSGSSASGQDAFQQVALYLNVGDRLNAPNLLEGWRLRQFASAGVATTFYLGEINAGVQHLFGRARPGVETDVRMLYLHVGWGPVVRLPLGVELTPSVDVGHVYMRFPQERISFRVSEGEAAWGLGARVAVPIRRGLYVDVGGRWTHIFTSDAIDLFVGSAGIRYRFDMPAWLRGVVE